MIQTRTLVCLCMLCALAVSAFAAQSASAIKGTTAFTCVKGAGTLKGEHCLAEGGAAEFGHVAIAQDTTTEVTATNEKTQTNTTASTPLRLKMTIAGVVTELEASVVEGEGWMENKIDTGNEHMAIAHGTLTFTNVKVLKPAGKGCKVFTDTGGVEGEEGVVHSEPLKTTTTAKGENFRIEPTTLGAWFAFFKIKGCEGEALKNLNQTYTVANSITCPVSGATINCTHAGTTGTLLVNNVIPAGIEGSLTLRGRAKGGGAYTPLSATTVET